MRPRAAGQRSAFACRLCDACGRGRGKGEAPPDTGGQQKGVGGGFSVAGHHARGVLARGAQDHLRQHHPVGRQRRRHRDGLPDAAAEATAVGHGARRRRRRAAARHLHARDRAGDDLPLPQAGRRRAAVLRGDQARHRGRRRRRRRRRGRANAVARGPHRRHRRHRDEPRQRHRDRGDRRDRGGAGRSCARRGHQGDADHLRPCHQRAADRRRLRDPDGAAGALPRAGVGRRRAARLGRGRRHGDRSGV